MRFQRTRAEALIALPRLGSPGSNPVVRSKKVRQRPSVEGSDLYKAKFRPRAASPSPPALVIGVGGDENQRRFAGGLPATIL